MKINRPTENRAVVLFGDISVGDCFELDGHLYIKGGTSGSFPPAVLLREGGYKLAYIASDTQCIPVDVEISYTYMSTEKDERND